MQFFCAYPRGVETSHFGTGYFWRSLCSIPFILAYARFLGLLQKTLGTTQIYRHIGRGLIGLLAMMFSFMLLMYLPVSYATASGFLAPVLVLPLACVVMTGFSQIERVTYHLRTYLELLRASVLHLQWRFSRYL